MSIDRPMNEYEGALFSALWVLTRAIRDLGAGREALASAFRDSALRNAELGHESAAAILEQLGKVAEGDTHWIPAPLFQIIDGGKSDDDPN
jgi:hypothetical protein